MKINKEKFWFIDGNHFSKSVYSKETAETASLTLKQCSNCIDCENCIGCIDCIGCKDCANCQNCENCTVCRNLIESNSCFKCINCEFSSYLIKSKFCIHCDNLTDEENENNLSGIKLK